CPRACGSPSRRRRVPESRGASPRSAGRSSRTSNGACRRGGRGSGKRSWGLFLRGALRSFRSRVAGGGGVEPPLRPSARSCSDRRDDQLPRAVLELGVEDRVLGAAGVDVARLRERRRVVIEPLREGIETGPSRLAEPLVGIGV